MAHNVEIRKRIKEIIKLLDDCLSEEEDTNTISKNVSQTIIEYAYLYEGEERNDGNEEFHETYDGDDIEVDPAAGPQTTQLIPEILSFTIPILADVGMNLLSPFTSDRKKEKEKKEICPPIPPWCNQYPYPLQYDPYAQQYAPYAPQYAPYAPQYTAPYDFRPEDSHKQPASHQSSPQNAQYQAPYQPPGPQNLAPPQGRNPVELLPGAQIASPERTQASKPSGDRKPEESPSPTKAMRQGAPQTTKSSPPDRGHRAPRDPYQSSVKRPGQTLGQPGAPELTTIFDPENQSPGEPPVRERRIRQPSKGARSSSPAKKKHYSRSISVIDQLYNDITEIEKKINETIEEITKTYEC